LPVTPEVIAEAKRGSNEAVATLYRGHVAMVRGYLQVSGVIEADDVTSEVFVSMVRNLPRFEGDPGNFRSWLMTIAHRRMVDHRRRSSANHSFAVGLVDESRLPNQELNDGFPVPMDGYLVQALHHLTKEQREVLGLRFLADLDVETVAAITGRSPGAVKALQHRALRTLRQSPVGRQLREASGR
jgi:RNA polymerase sigma-70 factor (ECF subfamily)